MSGNPQPGPTAPRASAEATGAFSPEVGHKFNSTPISKKINITLTSNCSFIKNTQKREVGASSPPRSRGTQPQAPRWEPRPEGGRWAPGTLLTLRSPVCSHLPPPPDPACPHTELCQTPSSARRTWPPARGTRGAPPDRDAGRGSGENAAKLSQPYGRCDNNFFPPRFGIQQMNLKMRKDTRVWVSVCALGRAAQ